MGEKQPRFEGNKIAKEEDKTLDCKVDQKSQGTFPKSRLQKYHFTLLKTNNWKKFSYKQFSQKLN